MAKKQESIEHMKLMLQESDMAFTITMETGGANNTDFADYTSNHFISGFRHVMQKPDLSRAQLASMLRAAERRRKRQEKTSERWADTIAAIISKKSNSNHVSDMC